MKWSDEAVEAGAKAMFFAEYAHEITNVDLERAWHASSRRRKEHWRSRAKATLTGAVEAEIKAGRAKFVTEPNDRAMIRNMVFIDSYPVIILRIETDKDKGK